MSSDLSRAPKGFEVNGKQATFVDFIRSDIALRFDVASDRASVHAKVTFRQPSDGAPVFDLVPDPVRLAVDGKRVAPAVLARISDPDHASHWRLIDETLSAGEHTVEFDYPLTEGVSFKDGAVDFRIQMSDLSSRKYLEQYFPANALFDRAEMHLAVRIDGAKRDQRIFTNGKSQRTSSGEYRVSFPAFFGAASPYLHIVDAKDVAVKKGSYEGKNGRISITAYGNDPNELEDAIASIQASMRTNEEAFGPYPYKSFVAQIIPNGDSMEYAGAARSERSSLRHEVSHSWFGRGVFPAGGRDGWIDEAIATWEDGRFRRARRVSVEGPFPVLAGFSQYKRETTEDAYDAGEQVMAELDFLLRDKGGLRPALADFYRASLLQTISTEDFEQFLSAWSGQDLRSFFDAKVYGGKRADG